MIAPKPFEVDQLYILKKKSDEKQILSNNKNKALINNLIDQIKFLKNDFRSKDAIIKLIMENSKYNNEYFQNKNNNYSNQIEKFVTPKNPAKSKISDNTYLNNFVSLNGFNVLQEKEIDVKENHHDKQMDLISCNADQP